MVRSWFYFKFFLELFYFFWSFFRVGDILCLFMFYIFRRNGFFLIFRKELIVGLCLYWVRGVYVGFCFFVFFMYFRKGVGWSFFVFIYVIGSFILFFVFIYLVFFFGDFVENWSFFFEFFWSKRKWWKGDRMRRKIKEGFMVNSEVLVE